MVGGRTACVLRLKGVRGCGEHGHGLNTVCWQFQRKERHVIPASSFGVEDWSRVFLYPRLTYDKDLKRSLESLCYRVVNPSSRKGVVAEDVFRLR